MFDAADINDALDGGLDAFGQTVEINGHATHAIIDTRTKVADDLGDMIVTDPTAKVATSDVEALLIKGGETGSELLVGTKYYRVLSVMDDGDGFTTLRLAAS